MSSAYCSWYSTGGSIPGLLEQLSEQDLNATNSVGNTGNMFEVSTIVTFAFVDLQAEPDLMQKFSAYDIE